MRVLVYGAGVLGCLLTHRLLASGRADVALLARGAWADAIERDGLTIRHVLQRRTTVDRVRIVRELAPGDAYDLAFAVMQAGQLPGVLPALARGGVERVVFVGNNADAAGTAARLAELDGRLGPQTARLVADSAGPAGSDASEGGGSGSVGSATPAAAGLPFGAGPREVAFAFQSTGGRRENGRVVSVYARAAMTLGGADGPLSEEFHREVGEFLGAAGYRVTREDRMDAWLKCHLAFVLPIAFTSYACGCDLRRATRAQRRAILDACREGYALLAARGIPIRPDGDEAYLEPGPRRALLAAMVLAMAKTPLGRLAATDHCAHAVAEMRDLTRDFERLREPTPAAGVTSHLAAPTCPASHPAAPAVTSRPAVPACPGSPAVRPASPVAPVSAAHPGSPAAPTGPAAPARPAHPSDRFAMPAWDVLRSQMPSWDDLLIDSRCAFVGRHR